MKKILFLIVLACFSQTLKSQSSKPDTVEFMRLLQYANKLADYDFLMQISMNEIKKFQSDTAASTCFGLHDRNEWHTICGSFSNNKFTIASHYCLDSAFKMKKFTGTFDTTLYISAAHAMNLAQKNFQPVLDSTSIYFDSFLIFNNDNTMSVWFLPAFQPSGQAIYGWEWEYKFDSSGTRQLTCNSHTGVSTGVWIGQPREIWLNYRNFDAPTVGSLYFALTYRDYFTRLRIDTRICTSTTSKDKTGNYYWHHKSK